MQQDAKTTHPDTLLAVRDLEVSFGGTPVLHGISLNLRRGERVAIVGQSGSGKSTTVAAVLRLLPGSGRITAGSIELDGTDLAGAPEARMRGIRGRHIGLVPQDPMSNLNPAMKVGAQIADALISNGSRGVTENNREGVKRRAVELMAEAGIPEAERRYGQYPHEFSGGMRQRVLIAIALAGDPELLIADEPTSALDVTVQRQILNHLQKLVEARGTTLLFITHDLGLAADRTDRIIVMADGRIVEEGTPQQILLDPVQDYTKALVAAAPSVSAALSPEDSSAAAPAEHPPEPVVEVRRLVKEFKLRGQRGQVVQALNDVSFTVARGTTTAVVGESGSGKTTVARILLGLETPSGGEALVGGESISASRGPERRRLRRMVQPVFQDPY